MGPLITLFWTSGDVCPGFPSQGGSFSACFLACVILRFTSGATPADCRGENFRYEPSHEATSRRHFCHFFYRTCIPTTSYETWPGIWCGLTYILLTDLDFIPDKHVYSRIRAHLKSQNSGRHARGRSNQARVK